MNVEERFWCRYGDQISCAGQALFLFLFPAAIFGAEGLDRTDSAGEPGGIHDAENYIS